MYEAMKEARTTIADLSTGRLTWGAYQHYGNPYFQFFQKPLTYQDEDQRPAKGKETTAKVKKTAAGPGASAARGEALAAGGEAPALDGVAVSSPSEYRCGGASAARARRC
jgi:hypothetical protein